MSSRSTLLAVAVLLAAALGCGKQGPPLPPLRNVPATTKDFAVEQQGPRLRMSLSYPQVTPAGLALQGISAVEVWSTARPAPDGKAAAIDPREFASLAKPVQKIADAELTAATSGSRIELSLPLPPLTVAATVAAPTTPPAPAAKPAAGAAPGSPVAAPGPAPGPIPQATYYAVRTFGKAGDRSDFSNIASVVPKAPPAAPDRVAVTPRADGILVEWTASPGAAAGYNVYRRGAQERSNGKPVHTSGAQEKSWLDSTARFGQSYIYSVTALAQQQPLLESGIASEREIHYIDRFAPPPPTDLVALAEARRVRLVWRPSEADDLAGYIVYRRAGDTGAFQRITPQPVVGGEYVDTGAAAGRTYAYRVTAIDQTGNESAPGNEVRANVP
jgi:hypothetical protein